MVATAKAAHDRVVAAPHTHIRSAACGGTDPCIQRLATLAGGAYAHSPRLTHAYAGNRQIHAGSFKKESLYFRRNLRRQIPEVGECHGSDSFVLGGCVVHLRVGLPLKQDYSVALEPLQAVNVGVLYDTVPDALRLRPQLPPRRGGRNFQPATTLFPCQGKARALATSSGSMAFRIVRAVLRITGQRANRSSQLDAFQTIRSWNGDGTPVFKKCLLKDLKKSSRLLRPMHDAHGQWPEPRRPARYSQGRALLQPAEKRQDSSRSSYTLFGRLAFLVNTRRQTLSPMAMVFSKLNS